MPRKRVIEATTDHPAIDHEGSRLVAGKKSTKKPLLHEGNTPPDVLDLAAAHPDTRHLTEVNLRAQMLADAEQEEATENVPIPANADELVKAAEETYDLKDEIDRKEAETKQLKDRYDQLRKVVIPEAMKALNMVNSKGKGSFTFSRGKIHLEQRLYASCSEENKPILFAFLKEEGAGDLIKPTVNASSLAAYIRERRGDGLNDPPGASIHEEVTAKLTKGR